MPYQPGDIRGDFERFADALGRISRLQHIERLKREADQTDRRRCGNCTKWMKSRICPKEKNVNGYSKGPSSEAAACSEFEIEQWVVDLKAKRMAEVGRLLSEFEQAQRAMPKDQDQ